MNTSKERLEKTIAAAQAADRPAFRAKCLVGGLLAILGMAACIVIPLMATTNP